MKIFQDINIFLLENNLNYTSFEPTTEPTYMPSYLTNNTISNNSYYKISTELIIALSLFITIGIFSLILTIYLRERTSEKLRLNIKKFENDIIQNMEENCQNFAFSKSTNDLKTDNPNIESDETSITEDTRC